MANAYLAIAHSDTPFVSIYERINNDFVKLPDPASLPPGDGREASFDSTNTYLAVSSTTTPFLTIYKRSGSTFTKLTDPATSPTGFASGVEFDPTSTYLAVAHGTAPYITIYKRSGDTFTKLADPAELPTGTGYQASWDSTSTYLVVAHLTFPYITIYKRSGDTFTKLPNPASRPTANCFGASFDPSGTYLVVGQSTTPFIVIYKRSGDTFTRQPTPSVLPPNTVLQPIWDPTGTYLVCGSNGVPYLSVYKRDGDTFNRIADPAEQPAGRVDGGAFDATGKYFAAPHGTTGPYLALYKLDGDTFIKIPNPDTPPPNLGYGASWAQLAFTPSSVAPDVATQPLTSGVDFTYTHESDGTQTGYALKRRSYTFDSAGLSAPSAEEWWNETAQDIASSFSPIDTTTTLSGLAFNTGRHLDRTSAGRLWAGMNDDTDLLFWYSDDNGATWTQNTSATISAVEDAVGFSFFIDVDDHAHVVYKAQTGTSWYRRMAGIGAATSWSAAFSISGTYDEQFDIVAFPEGASWRAAVVASNNTSTRTFIVEDVDTTPSIAQTLTTPNDGYGSIDFHHTGDSKTVAGGTPHLYLMTIDGPELRYVRIAYAAGTYTVGSSTTLDTVGTKSRRSSLIYDGTRVVIAYAEDDLVMVIERDEADTTTTVLTPPSFAAEGFLRNVSVTYDEDQNIHVWASGNISDDLKRVKYDRTAGTWGSWTTVFANDMVADSLSLRRGHSDGLMGATFLNGAASPYNMAYASFFAAPANSWVGTEVENASTTQPISLTDWSADWDTYDYAIATSVSGAIGPYSDWKSLNPYEWWDGSSWVPMVETYVPSGIEEVELSAVEADFTDSASYQWSVSTRDEYEGGEYAALTTFVVIDPPTVPSAVAADLTQDHGVGWTHDGATYGAQVGWAVRRRSVSFTGGELSYGAAEWWDGTFWVGTETINVGAAASTVLTGNSWAGGAFASYEIAVATEGDLGLSAYGVTSLNPYEWWDGSSWAPMTETYVTSALDEVTVPKADIAHEGKQYEWTVATRSNTSALVTYAATVTYEVSGSFARWGAVFI